MVSVRPYPQDTSLDTLFFKHSKSFLENLWPDLNFATLSRTAFLIRNFYKIQFLAMVYIWIIYCKISTWYDKKLLNKFSLFLWIHRKHGVTVLLEWNHGAYAGKYNFISNSFLICETSLMLETQFDPFWFILIHFDSFWYILIHFDPFWSILIHFDPFWSILTHSDPFRSILIHFDPF